MPLEINNKTKLFLSFTYEPLKLIVYLTLKSLKITS